MTLSVLAAALAVAAVVPLIRCLWCLVGLIRLFPNHARANRSEWGWLQLAIAPEAYVLSAAAVALGMQLDAALADASLVALTCALVGAAAALTGLAVSVWTFVTFPTIGTGHYVANGQIVISRGPYGWVRHPTYLGVLLMRFGLGLAYRDVFVLALAVGVGALYALYARSEERMMLAAFGGAYSSYRSCVGSFLPKSLRPFRARATARSSRARALAAGGLGLIVVAAVYHAIDSIGGPDAVRERYGAWGFAVSFVAHWVLNLTPFGGLVPTAAANGALWGFWIGALVSWAGWLAASLTQYRLVRWVAGEPESEVWARLPEWLGRLPVEHPLVQIGGRSLPWVGLHVVSVSAALAGVPLGRFLAYAALGQAGPALAMAALGSGLVSLMGA